MAEFGPRSPRTVLERLWTVLAYSQGELVDASKLANSIGTSLQTVTRYIDVLACLLLVRRPPPLRANVRKRLVKSQRGIRDRPSAPVGTGSRLSSFSDGSSALLGGDGSILLGMLPAGSACGQESTSTRALVPARGQ